MGKTAKLVLAYDRTPANNQDFGRDLELLQKLAPYVDVVKLGLEAMTAHVFVTGQGHLNVATEVRRKMREAGIPVLWDQKIHDIGNTARNAIQNLGATKGITGITVHASMSDNALREVAKAVREGAFAAGVSEPPRIFGVTVLTDIGVGECEERFGLPPEKVVVNFAGRLIDAGIDGIVCSARELENLASNGLTEKLTTLVPGLRSSWADPGDQKRIMTPAEAVVLGADYLVIGRQILGAADPVKAAKLTREEIDAAERA